MKLLVSAILLLLVLPAWAQTPGGRVIDVSQVNDSVLLYDCPVFVDSLQAVSPAQALQQHFVPLSAYGIKTRIPEKWITKRVYLKLHIANSSAVPDSIYFFPGISYRSIRLYEVKDTNTLVPVKDESSGSGYQPLVVGAGTVQLYIAELHFARYAFTYLNPQLIKKNYLEKFQRVQYYRNAPMQVVSFVISGILLMMFIFSLANFLLSRRKEFLLNALYVACMFLLIFFSVYFEKKSGVWVAFFQGYLAFALLAAGTGFYIAFTRRFINTTINFPRLNRLFVMGEWLVAATLLAFSFLYFFTENYSLHHAIENTLKIAALALGLVYIITAFTQKNRLLNYLAIGNAILIGFSILSFILLQFPKKGGIFYNSLFYYELGIVGELTFFLLGLTYKNRMELIEKVKYQETMKLLAEKQEFETRLAVLQARQKERNRISADMHDELGAGITAIRLYSELAKAKAAGTWQPEMEKISNSANELLNNMNTIIWAMSSSNDTLENMTAYIRSYAQEYFDNTGITCRISIMEQLPNIEVSGAIRKNVFMVVKESLSNILKHANATEVNITFTKVENGLALYIHDNGVGIDLEKLRRFGNGLNNMKKRMEEMNIHFSIENRNGTLVTLQYAIAL